MPVVIIGLVAAALTLTVILLRGRRRAVTSQHLEVLAQERERQNEEALEGDADAQICLLHKRLKAAEKRKSPLSAEKESTPIDSSAEMRQNQEFVLNVQCKYTGKIDALTKFNLPRQEALIKDDVVEIHGFTLDLCSVKLRRKEDDLSNGYHFLTATRKRICLHQKELRILEEYLKYIVDVGEPTYFCTFHIEKEDRPDMEEPVTVRELFEQVIFYRIRDQTVTELTEKLLDRLDRHQAKYLELTNKLRYEVSELEKFNGFISSTEMLAESYLGGWRPKVPPKDLSQETKPTDDSAATFAKNNSEADSSDSVEENPNED